MPPFNETQQDVRVGEQEAEHPSPLNENFAPPRLKMPPLRWSVGFLGVLGYLFVEYMRLSAQYPIFRAIYIGKVVIGICVLGWVIAPRVPGKRPAVFLLDGPMLALVFVSVLSACFAHYQEQAWTGVLDIFMWAVIYFLIGRIVVSSWRQRIFVLLLLLLNLKMAQASIRNFHAVESSGLDARYLASVGIGAGSAGFFANGSELGVAMCVVWPLAGILLLAEKKLVPRIILLASFFGFSGAIVVCGSRGAVVGAAVSALVAWARNARRFSSAILFLPLIPGIYFALPKASKDRLESAIHWKQDSTASSRIVFWEAGLKMFEDHPLLGVGPDNFPLSYFEKYSHAGDPVGEWEAHDIYIQALSELGLLGAIPVLLLFVGCFRLNARTRKYALEHGGGKPRGFDYYMAMGLDLALVGYMVSGTFLTVLYYPHLWVILGMSVGLHTAVTSKPPEKTEFAVDLQGGSLALAGSAKGGPKC